VLACLALGGGAIVGYRYWYDSVHFVSTDNAQIAGDLIQVGSLNAGRIGEVVYDVGAQVRQDDVVATLYAPVPVGITPNGSQRMEIRATDDSLIEVRSPIAGVVVARAANPGDTVPAGQPLLTVVDSRKLWVNANVEESQIRWIRPGQPVAIHVDTLALDLTGRVLAIRPASVATFSLLPTQSVSGNFTKETQYVPVKIALDQPDPRLMIGTSAEVSIRVVQ
jgi:multidrug resistance efflux pump